MNNEIPNADLIRAVLDGREVQWSEGHGWHDISSLQAIRWMCGATTASKGFRLKPETVKTYMAVAKWHNEKAPQLNHFTVWEYAAQHAEALKNIGYGVSVLTIEIDPSSAEIVKSTKETL